MWETDTRWFDVSVVLGLFAAGSILFGRFEQHKPRVRRLLKVVVILAVTVGLASTAGRIWAYGVLAVPLAVAAWVHLVWLPRHGISGWTAEPYDKYLALVTSRARRRRPA